MKIRILNRNDLKSLKQLLAIDKGNMPLNEPLFSYTRA